MLLKFLLALGALFSHNGNHNSERLPKLGPQTEEEEAITRRSFYSRSDMVFPDNWNESNAGIKDRSYLWPKSSDGLVYIPIDLHNSAYNSINQINFAIDHYRKFTCIRFRERQAQDRNWIRIFYGNGCWSVIGCNGGPQDLSLGDGCNWPGLVVHELGHAIGLFHEHQRSDRDNYITVYRNNVVAGQEHNFDLTDRRIEWIMTPYDYDSIMHYGTYAFSRAPNQWPTMLAKNGHKLVEPWQKAGFTNSDIYEINTLYGCKK